jgi:hypothetical protein
MKMTNWNEIFEEVAANNRADWDKINPVSAKLKEMLVNWDEAFEEVAAENRGKGE